MNFNLTAEQRDLVNLVRKIAKEKVEPVAARMDEAHEFPQDLFDTLAGAGLFGLWFDEKYGGTGMGTLGLCLAVEEVAKYCCSTGLALLLSKLPLGPIWYGGTEEQKQHYLRGVAEGKLRGGFCLSEPDAGSDAANIRCRAVRSGNKYILNGTKSWISGATYANFYTVAAKTDPNAGARGFSVFIVPRDQVKLGKPERKMGVRGLPISQVILEDAEVPVENRLGEENQGFKVIMNTLNSVRPVVAARGIGLAQGALMYATHYIQERKTFGQRVIDHQGIRWMLAELATEIEAARLLTYRAAQIVDEGKAGKEVAPFLSMAKYYATEVAQKAATDCLQLLGANGYMEDYPLERFYRDVKQLTIVEGTTQIQKNIIGGAIADGILKWW